MNKLDIHLQDLERTVPVLFSDEETLKVLIGRIEADAGVDGLSIISLATDLSQMPDHDTSLKHFKFKYPAIHIRRVCVQVHFEGDSAKQVFPVHAHWSQVHRWASLHFHVAHDVSANLELHEGSATGIKLNERKEIGQSDECKEVWLIKPGAEPNG